MSGPVSARTLATAFPPGYVSPAVGAGGPRGFFGRYEEMRIETKIRVACPGCGRALAVPAARAGSLASCPVCRARFEIPAEPIAEPPATPRPPTATRAPLRRPEHPEHRSGATARIESDESDEWDEKPVRRRKAGRRRNSNRAPRAWYLGFGGVLVCLGAFVLVVLGLSLLQSAAALLLILASVAVFGVGNIWFLVIAFGENAQEGLLCLLVPGYAIYYTATRFGAVWRPLSLYGIGLGMLLLGALILAKWGFVLK